MPNLSGWTGVIVLVIVLLLFGAPRLPGLARSLGQSLKILKTETRSDETKSDATGSDPVESSESTDTNPKP